MERLIMKLIEPAILMLWLSASSALAADAAERKFIREGMSEGEVLVKIGKPDSESVDSGGGAAVTVKRWIYLPTPADQQTMTTIVLRNGKVIDVDRKVTY
jgi:hypothetical protein